MEKKEHNQFHTNLMDTFHIGKKLCRLYGGFVSVMTIMTIGILLVALYFGVINFIIKGIFYIVI